MKYSTVFFKGENMTKVVLCTINSDGLAIMLGRYPTPGTLHPRSLSHPLVHCTRGSYPSRWYIATEVSIETYLLPRFFNTKNKVIC